MTSSEEAFTLEQALANLEQTQDLGLRYYAAWWLGRFRVNTPQVIDLLLNALEDEDNRSPDGGYPLRRNAARALGKLQETRVVPALVRCLDSTDYYVREAAAQSLEMLGESSCILALVKLLEGGVEAAVPVAGKPHLVQPYEAVLEALGTLGAKEYISQIEPFLGHSVEKVQLAAARALYQLTKEEKYANRLIAGLEAQKLPLRRSALIDLGATDYLPAASAIAKTLAENSLKLISLKGLLENHLTQSALDPEGNLSSDRLTPESLQVMGFMDQLL